ncbi:MAG: hypothetical protein ABIJ50_01865, partial [Pseudomonadota bacterium]
NLVKTQKSLSFRVTMRNLAAQPVDTIKISPDGRNDIIVICTFYETINFKKITGQPNFPYYQKLNIGPRQE